MFLGPFGVSNGRSKGRTGPSEFSMEMALNIWMPEKHACFSLSTGGLYNLRIANDESKFHARRRKTWLVNYLHALFAPVRREVFARKDPKPRFRASLVTRFTRREFGENAIADAT